MVKKSLLFLTDWSNFWQMRMAIFLWHIFVFWISFASWLKNKGFCFYDYHRVISLFSLFCQGYNGKYYPSGKMLCNTIIVGNKLKTRDFILFLEWKKCTQHCIMSQLWKGMLLQTYNIAPVASLWNNKILWCWQTNFDDEEKLMLPAIGYHRTKKRRQQKLIVWHWEWKKGTYAPH